jgi:nicotinamidase-related amidase
LLLRETYKKTAAVVSGENYALYTIPCIMSPLPSTAILIIDPYNDFLHPSGKLNSLLAESLKETNTIQNLQILVKAARERGIPIFYGLHQQHKPGFIADWKHATSMQKSQRDSMAFEEGSWGVEIYEGLKPDISRGDVVVSKHWCSR